ELVAEPLRDAVDRLVIDNDRAESLVATVESLLGLKEEAAVWTPLHDAASRTLIIFRPEIAVHRIPQRQGQGRGGASTGLTHSPERPRKWEIRGPNGHGTVWRIAMPGRSRKPGK